MTPTLYLGPVPKTFDRHRDLAASIASFINQEDLIENWEDLPFVQPHPPQDHVEYYANLLLDELCTILTKTLNQQHQIDYSTAYWRRLLISWLIELFSISFCAYLLTDELVKKHKKTALHVSILELSSPWHIIDPPDFESKGLCNLLFFEWLLGQYIQANLTPNWTISKKKHSPEKENRKASRRDYRARRCLGIKGLSTSQELFLSAMLKIKSHIKPLKPCPKRSTFCNPPPSSKNTQSLYDHWNTSFKPIFFKHALRHLPKHVTDNFAFFHARAKKKWFFKGGIRLVSTLFYSNPQGQHYLALAEEKGEQLIGSQHGGNYGHDRFHYPPYKVERENNHFLSWGWTQQSPYSTTATPLSSPMLSKLAKKTKKQDTNTKKQTIILIGTNMWAYGLGLFFNLYIGTSILDYRKNKLRFIKTLKNKKNFVYRPYPRSKNFLDDEGYIRKHAPYVPILNTPAFEAALLQAKCLVLDHPGTTLNIALAINKPIVVYVPKTCQWSTEANPFFTALEQAKILFYSPKQAAEHLNHVHNTLDDWWYSEAVQTARKQWINTFAKTSPHYFIDWVKTLWDL